MPTRRTAALLVVAAATVLTTAAPATGGQVVVDPGAAAPVTSVVLVRGDVFADALTAGPMAGRQGSALLLTAGPEQLGEPVRAFLAEHAPTLESVHVLGGPSAVSDGVVQELAAVLGG